MHSVLTHKALLFVKLLRYIRVGCHRHNPAALPLINKPIVLEAGWAPRPDGSGAENLAPTRIRSLDCPGCRKSL